MAYTHIRQALNGLGSSTDVDTKQYVVHNADGLFLTAEAGALVPNSSHTSFKLLQQNIDRVEISWDGLKLRNWNNDVTFFANPETGNLFISGVLDANNVKVLTNSADWYSYLHHYQIIFTLKLPLQMLVEFYQKTYLKQVLYYKMHLNQLRIYAILKKAWIWMQRFKIFLLKLIMV